MGVIDRYGVLLHYNITVTKHTPYIKTPERRKRYVAPEYIQVTLADVDDRSCDYITAHDLRDYRRKSFNILMMPRVNLPYDAIAEEVYGLSIFTV